MNQTWWWDGVFCFSFQKFVSTWTNRWEMYAMKNTLFFITHHHLIHVMISMILFAAMHFFVYLLFHSFVRCYSYICSVENNFRIIFGSLQFINDVHFYIYTHHIVQCTPYRITPHSSKSRFIQTVCSRIHFIYLK